MWEGIPNHHGWHLSQEPHSLEKMDSLPGGWPEFALLRFPSFHAYEKLSRMLSAVPRTHHLLQEEPHKTETQEMRQKRAILFQTKMLCWEVDGRCRMRGPVKHLPWTFFYLSRITRLFCLGPQCSKLQSHCKWLYSTPTPNLKPALEWTSMHSSKSEWVSHTREKEHLVNAVPGIINWAHYKANQGALQFHKRKKDSARIQGNCEGTGESDIKPGETPEFQVQQEMGYLEQDVTGQRKPFAPPTLHWAPSLA